jgi:uncharacterized membrane protein YqjE
MFRKLGFSKLLLLFGLAIALIHVVLLGLAIVIHVALLVPCLRKAVMKHSSCCK